MKFWQKDNVIRISFSPRKQVHNSDKIVTLKKV